MNDGVIYNRTNTYQLERIELKLNRYGLLHALCIAGLVPQGFQVETVYFDDNDNTLLEISLTKETPVSRNGVSDE